MKLGAWAVVVIAGLAIQGCATSGRDEGGSSRIDVREAARERAERAGTTAWAQFLHDARNTGRSDAVGPQKTPELKWRYGTDNRLEYCAPSVGKDGSVYVADCNVGVGGYLYSLDGESGEPRWRFRVEGGGAGGAAAVSDGDLVYVRAWQGKVYAVKARPGTVKWSRTVDYGEVCAPTVGPDGNVYVGADKGYLYCFDGKTGKTKWEHETGGTLVKPAVDDEGTVYILVWGDAQELRAIDGKNGKLKWRLEMGKFDSRDDIFSSPCVDGKSRVFVGGADGNLYAVDAKRGRELWRFRTGGKVACPPVLGGNGLVYVGSEDKKLYAVEAATGRKKWEFDAGMPVVWPVAVDRLNTVYLGSRKLYALDGDTGKQKWSVEMEGDWADSAFLSPAIGASGRLYVCHAGMPKEQMSPWECEVLAYDE